MGRLAQTARRPLQARVFRSIEALRRDWEELALRVRALPFVRPGWFAAWRRAFGDGTLELHAVYEGGRLVGVLPLVRRFGMVLAATNAWTPDFALVAESPEAAAALAASALARPGWRFAFDHLQVGRLGTDEILRAASEAGEVDLKPQRRSPYLEIDGDWASYEAGLGSRLRTSLRRGWSRLRQQGTPVADLHTGLDGLDTALGEAFAVEAAGWKGDQGTAIASRPETFRFYTEAARWAAENGHLRLTLLRLDGRPIAFQYAIEADSVLYSVKIGHDPAFSRYGPGILLKHAVLERSFAAGLQRVEFLGHDEPHKLAWTHTCHDVNRLQVFPRTLSGRLAGAAARHGRPRILGRLHRATGL